MTDPFPPDEPPPTRPSAGHFGVVVGRFYEELAARLVTGVSKAFDEAGATFEVHDVPGAYELPLAALYLAQEGRGIGLLNKLRAYNLQDEGFDTVDANLELGLPVDLRDYGIGAQILADLGLSSIRILTNNPKKIRGLEGYGLSVTAQIPIIHTPNPHNENYLRAKAERMGHTLHHQGLALDEEMIHEEQVGDRERAAADADLYGQGPAPRRRP